MRQADGNRGKESKVGGEDGVRGSFDIVTSVVFQNGPQIIWDQSCAPYNYSLAGSRGGQVVNVKLGKADCSIRF